LRVKQLAINSDTELNEGDPAIVMRNVWFDTNDAVHVEYTMQVPTWLRRLNLIDPDAEVVPGTDPGIPGEANEGDGTGGDNDVPTEDIIQPDEIEETGDEE
jgi:hypothetical protein